MALFQSLSVIFLIVGLGMLCKRRGILDDTKVEGFEVFLLKIGMPAYLFISTLQHDLTTLVNTQYVIAYLLTFLFVSVLVILLFYKTSPLSALCIKILASGYGNAAIYALPMIVFLLGDPTAGILSNILQLIIIQPIFVTILSFIRHKEKSIFKNLLEILSTPVIIMPILGLTFNYLSISLHPILMQAVQSVGNIAPTLALFTFGLIIGGINITKVDLNKNLISIILIKNIAHPIAAFCIGKYLLHLEDYWLYSLVITASSPTAFIVYIIAKQFTIEQELVKKVAVLSAFVSLISIIFITFMLG